MIPHGPSPILFLEDGSVALEAYDSILQTRVRSAEVIARTIALGSAAPRAVHFIDLSQPLASLIYELFFFLNSCIASAHRLLNELLRLGRSFLIFVIVSESCFTSSRRRVIPIPHSR